MCVGGRGLVIEFSVAGDDIAMLVTDAIDRKTGLEESLVNLTTHDDGGLAHAMLIFVIPKPSDADVGLGSDQFLVGEEDGVLGDGRKADEVNREGLGAGLGELHVLGGARTSSATNCIPSTSFTETFYGQKEDPHLSRQTEAGAVVRSNVPAYLSASRGNRPLWLALGGLLTAKTKEDRHPYP